MTDSIRIANAKGLRNPIRDIQVVRAIEDGQFVFVHVYQSLNSGEAKWVTADLFDTDEDGLPMTS